MRHRRERFIIWRNPWIISHLCLGLFSPVVSHTPINTSFLFIRWGFLNPRDDVVVRTRVSAFIIIRVWACFPRLYYFSFFFFLFDVWSSNFPRGNPSAVAVIFSRFRKCDTNAEFSPFFRDAVVVSPSELAPSKPSKAFEE